MYASCLSLTVIMRNIYCTGVELATLQKRER